MADYDFELPSFSLGLDLDLQSEPQTTPLPHLVPQPATRPSTTANLRTIEEDDDDDFESPVRVSDPPRALKRLRLGAKILPQSVGWKVNYEDQRSNADDEIQNFSNTEDYRKVLSHHCTGRRFVSSESGIRYNSGKGKEVPIASASINVDTRGSNLIFPESTVSPLRRFHLIDSDSDEPSTIKDACEEMPSVILSSEGNQGTETSVEKHQISGSKSNCIPTPAFDEFCDEYFTHLKNKRRKIDRKDTGCGRKRDDSSLPTAHCYFFHNDSRIQKLARERLCHFIPFNPEYKQQNVSVIDYMGQFGCEDDCRKNVEKSSSRRKKSSKVENIRDHSEGWITPKSSGSVQRNVGSQRVKSVSGSSGNWYTGQDGRRVYVTKNGQELTGQIAYRHYKKETGKGLRNSKKKKAAKKKTASKK